MNGFMSFAINYLAYRPTPFPHQNDEDADLLAPFWADADSSLVSCDCTAGCMSCGTDVVYYQVYSYVSLQSTPQGLAVLAKANADGRAYIIGFQQADWVMVVTWSQVIPYRYTYNQYSFEVHMFFSVVSIYNSLFRVGYDVMCDLYRETHFKQCW